MAMPLPALRARAMKDAMPTLYDEARVRRAMKERCRAYWYFYAMLGAMNYADRTRDARVLMLMRHQYHWYICWILLCWARCAICWHYYAMTFDYYLRQILFYHYFIYYLSFFCHFHLLLSFIIIYTLTCHFTFHLRHYHWCHFSFAIRYDIIIMMTPDKDDKDDAYYYYDIWHYDAHYIKDIYTDIDDAITRFPFSASDTFTDKLPHYFITITLAISLRHARCHFSFISSIFHACFHCHYFHRSFTFHLSLSSLLSSLLLISFSYWFFHFLISLVNFRHFVIIN